MRPDPFMSDLLTERASVDGALLPTRGTRSADFSPIFQTRFCPVSIQALFNSMVRGLVLKTFATKWYQGFSIQEHDAPEVELKRAYIEYTY